MGKFAAIIIITFALCISIYSQTKQPGITKTDVINTTEENRWISEIVKNLNDAKKNESIEAKEYWEQRLNEATGTMPIVSSSNLFFGKRETNEENNSNILGVSQLTGQSIKANVISRERVNGDIYAAVSIAGAQTDTIRIFRSTNNGISFIPIYSVFFNNGYKINDNGLDIEAISRGDSSYAFVSFGITYGSGPSSSEALSVLRVRQDGGMFKIYINNFTSTEKITNGRITSDNARFLITTDLYFSQTFNYNDNGSRREVLRLFKITSPFLSSSSITPCYTGNLYGSYGYEIPGNANDNIEFESDIAFVNTPGDLSQIYTVTIVNGFPGAFDDGASLFFTRSNTYGATQPTLFKTSEIPYIKKSPRIAATGFSNSTLCVLVKRQFSATDWDPYNFFCADINAATPSFSSSYVNSNGDETYSVSATARYRSNGAYLFSYSNSRLTMFDCFIRQYSSGTYGTETKINSVNADYNKGFPDVSFRNINNDSCISIWGGNSGFGSFVTAGCSGPFVSINNQSTIVEGYSLEQNYPNPFNPTTNINYALQKKGFVTLKIYDILGSEIKTLISENKPAGSYSVSFDGNKLSSGIYFYKINIGDFSDTKRMVLVK